MAQAFFQKINIWIKTSIEYYLFPLIRKVYFQSGIGSGISKREKKYSKQNCTDIGSFKTIHSYNTNFFVIHKCKVKVHINF